MKKVEEKAERYANEMYQDANEWDDEWDACYDGCMAGYNEAMRWRDPEVELPEFNKNDYLNGDYKRYLIKVVKGSISTRRYVTVGWLVNERRWNVEMDWVNVIGWRPIE